MREPWTHEALAELMVTLRGEVEQTEKELPDVRGLPPMAEDECKDMILALAETATARRLTTEEGFLVGQLLAQFKMGVLAAAMGKRGRYYVFSDEMLDKLRKGVTP